MIRHSKSFITILFAVGVVLISGVFPLSCRADALFIHDYQSNEYFLGEQNADLYVGYTENSMLLDKQTHYTGGWMKRFFGKVETKRETTHFLLKEKEIREIDWGKARVLVYPFEKLKDTSWLKQSKELEQEVQSILEERYKVTKPQLEITILPRKEKIGDYDCQPVIAHLRLETLDMKKNAKSITLVKQKLWVSEDVPGYSIYLNTQQQLADEFGLDSKRFGSMSFLLNYWTGSLDPIRDELDRINGYPVKSTLDVEAQYIKNVNSEDAETITKKIKQEQMILKDVRMAPLDKSLFAPPDNYPVVLVEK